MKKIFSHIFIILILISALFVSFRAYADDTISVSLDGNIIEFETQPCIIDNRTLVPVRGVLEAAGATVIWDSEARMTVGIKGDTKLMIGIDNPVMTVEKNDIATTSVFEVAPCIINDRTYVSIRNVAEALGINVGWNSEKKTVILNSMYEVSSVPNVITLSGFESPQNHKVGEPYIIKGEIQADGIIDRVNIKITDAASSRVQINETRFYVNKNIYHLSDIDPQVKFGRLSAGKKLMEITAVTKNESRQSFNFEFDVVRSDGIIADGPMSMIWPVPDSGLITTIFWCDNPFCHSNDGRPNGHTAIDIAAPENSDVLAVKNGTVVKTGFGDAENGFSGYGNFILIDHGDGITTQYSHLYSIYVNEGDTVTVGQVIGAVGSTGNSTGNHLDFAIEKDGERCDPLYYIDMHPEARCYEECDKPFFEEAMKKRENIITSDATKKGL